MHPLTNCYDHFATASGEMFSGCYVQIRINPESNPGSHNGLGEFALSQCFCVLMFF